MKFVPLGRTGVQVSALALGCMNFGWGTEEPASINIIRRAVDAGINFLDTANVYGRGASEEIVGKAMGASALRDRIFLATKVHHKMHDTEPNAWGNHRYHIISECENSLRRLNVDHIDLYQIHRPEPSIPIDETLRTMDDLIRSGKVRYIGTSTFAAWQLVESLWASKELHLNRFVTEQPPYNLLDRRIERELVPMCRTYGTGIIPWSPLAGGLLTGKYRKGEIRPQGSRYETEGSAPMNRDHIGAFDRIEAVISLAERFGLTPSVFSLAWVMNQPGITSTLIGPRTLEQLEDNLEAVNVVWTEEMSRSVDTIIPPGTHVSDYYKADFGPNARWI